MALDADAVAWLLTPAGTEATTAAERLLAGGTSVLAALDRLRRDHGAQGSRAAVTLAEGRRTAARKFADAGRLYFDRESAEQATSEVVARHTARRFEGARRIADLGCGAGADTLALAEIAPVLAVDRDPGRVALVRANAAARGLMGRVEAIEADATAPLPGEIDAVWLDPARRDGSGRVMAPERWSPPLSEAVRLATTLARAGIKVAPGIDLASVPPGSEVEFISLGGRLVEAVLWFGNAVMSPRTATALPAGVSLQGEADAGRTSIAEPGRYLYDLDPAVGRAGLVDVLAPTLDAWLLAEGVGYLSGDSPHETPFARRFRIEEWFAFSERRLLESLRRQDAARVEVMRRASPIDTNALEVRVNRSLEGGSRVLTVALTRSGAEHVAIVCERERD